MKNAYGLTKTEIRNMVKTVRKRIDAEGNEYRDYSVSRSKALRLYGYRI